MLQAADSDAQLRSWLERRTHGEPLAWLVGAVTFCGARVLVHPGVYVPRFQTEQLVFRAASRLAEDCRVIDVCTGAGAIAVALKQLVPTARVIGTEIDPLAIACARSNRVVVAEGDLFEGVTRANLSKTDLVIGVVPYVPTDQMHFLPRDVVEHEPRRALDGGVDGLDLLSKTASEARRFLGDGGLLMLELGGEQGDRLATELDALGYSDVELLFDDDGDLRGISASWRDPDRA